MSSRSTLLITGATGFLGSHILEGLIEKSEHDIVCLKRSTSSMSRISHLLGKFETFDLDRVPLEEVFRNRNVYGIIHTATEYGRENCSSYKVLETNLMFPIALIEEAIRKGVKCFFNTDSYFNKDHMSYSYLFNYSLSKKSLNSWLKYFSNQIKVVNVVLEHIYGPRDNETKFIEKMVQDIAVRKVDRVAATYGHQKRDFVFIDDVVAAYLKLLEMSHRERFNFRSYSVGTGTSLPIRTALETIARLSSSPTKLDFGALPYRDDEIMNSVGDISEISNLGWKPVHNLESGLRKTIDYYLKR